MPLDQPLFIVGDEPGLEGHAKVLDRAEGSHPQELFLERTNKSLRNAVAFWGAHERRARCDPQKPEFSLKIVTHILTPMIMPHLHARRDAGRVDAELSPNALANRLQGLEARGPSRGMEADPFEGTMIHADKDRDQAVLQRHGARRIGTPHLIRAHGRDGPVMVSRATHSLSPVRCQEVGLPHEPPHTGFRGPNALCPQARPDLAVALPEKRRGRDDCPDMTRERLIGVRGFRSPLGGDGWLGDAALLVITRRPTQAPFLADPDHTIRTLDGRRRGVAHRVDLPAAKGAPPRRRLTASRDSSRRIVRSPTSAFRRASSSSRPSAARLFKPACPLVTKCSRHSDSLAAVMLVSRETRSRSSPRSTSRTASTFFREENRPRSVFDCAMDTSINEGAVCPNCVSKEIVGRGTT